MSSHEMFEVWPLSSYDSGMSDKMVTSILKAETSGTNAMFCRLGQ